MSSDALPTEGRASDLSMSRVWLWVIVSIVVLIALAGGGLAGFYIGRDYERQQGGFPPYPDSVYWLIGASLVDRDGAVHIQQIAEGGPAESAGLHNGDRLVAITDTPVNSAQEAKRILASYGAGSFVSLTIERDRHLYQMGLQLGGITDIRPIPVPIDPTIEPPILITIPPYQPPDTYGEKHLGVYYRMLKPDDPFGVRDGALLIMIWSGSPAEFAGLAPGDIILAVNERQLSESYTLEDALRSPSRQMTYLTVHKTNGETVRVRVRLPY